MKTVRLDHKNAALMSLILAVLIICSVPDLLISNTNNRVLATKTSSYEKLYEFLLPVLPQEDQMFDGLSLIKAMKRPLQSNHNRLNFLLPGKFILLSNNIKLWKDNLQNNFPREHYLKSEISLRIGGHSPPTILL